jgi:hypothetical protein
MTTQNRRICAVHPFRLRASVKSQNGGDARIAESCAAHPAVDRDPGRGVRLALVWRPGNVSGFAAERLPWAAKVQASA